MRRFLTVAAVLLAFASTAAAAPVGEQITLDQKKNAVRFGDTVTFTVTGLRSLPDGYRVNVWCYQQDVNVFYETRYLPQDTTDVGPVTLTPNDQYAGGAAKCWAVLVSVTPEIAQTEDTVYFRAGGI